MGHTPRWILSIVVPLTFGTAIAGATIHPDADSGAFGHTAHDTPTTRNAAAGIPREPGQEMFGTIAEIVRILEASPSTDWSRVNIPALRKHLIDMNELALNAHAHITHLNNGVRIRVTGDGRTLGAIHRMVAMHARTMDRRFGWHFEAQPLPDGEMLTVTSPNPAAIRKIQGLGFMGIMVYGTHHGMHHLAIARGDMKY